MAISTSNTYNFQSITIELLIREAYERIGILGEFVEAQKLESANRSINFLLLEWMNKTTNLWTLETGFLPLVANQAAYNLPSTQLNIIQINLRTSTTTTIGGGAGESSSGVAANAFDGNPAGPPCTQTSPNGWIGYNYGNTVTLNVQLTSVGIQSAVTATYTLIVEYSLDNTNWNTLLVILAQAYPANVIVNFDIPALPLINAMAYRIRETGGATLNIAQLYFNNNVYGTSEGGIAANAFNGNPLTPCAQTAPNGWISYNYTATNPSSLPTGMPTQLTFVGIQSFTTQTYTLTVEISPDNVNWTTLFNIPVQSYPAGVIQWFNVPTPIDLITFPTQGQGYRIRETANATLNIQQLYFNNNVYDFVISPISRYEYLTLPYKNQASRPNTYYFDRQISPNLYIWPVPTPDYNCIQYSYKQMMQDVGNLYTNTLDIPAYFYPPLVAGLAWQLAIKFNPQMAQTLKMEYERSFSMATTENTESIPISIYPSWNGTRGGSYI